MQTFTRYSVNSAEGLKNLIILGKAVELMKELPADNPHSWEYQAGIHGTQNSSLKGKQFIDNCPHYFDLQAQEDTPHFFLIWHRLYLHYFEEAVRAVTGEVGFTLPYWDSTDKAQRRIPTPFLGVAEGGINGLLDTTRENNLNNGVSTLFENDKSRLARLNYAVKELKEQGEADFFVFNQSIDNNPHGLVHVAISGNMGDFETAALDPIFWVHHANIDRLWGKYAKDTINSEEIKQLKPGMTIGFFDKDQIPITYSYEDAAKEVYRLDYGYDSDSGAENFNAPNSLNISQGVSPPSIPAATALPIRIKNVGSTVNSLKKGDAILGWDTRINNRPKGSRAILTITIESCADLIGHIDLFYSDRITGGQNLMPKNNISFDRLAQRDNGRFLKRYYIGSVSFIPHAKDAHLEDSHQESEDCSAESHDTSHGDHEHECIDCGEVKVYRFDISDEIRLQRNMANVPDVVHFNIDPTQSNAEALENVLIKSIGITYT